MQSMNAALIIARSAQIRDSLFVLLRAGRRVKAIHEAADSVAAVAVAPEVQPALVLLDCDLGGDEAHESLRLIQAAWPPARTVVLVEGE